MACIGLLLFRASNHLSQKVRGVSTGDHGQQRQNTTDAILQNDVKGLRSVLVDSCPRSNASPSWLSSRLLTDSRMESCGVRGLEAAGESLLGKSGA